MFVNHVTTNPFFVPTIYGIEDASAILGTTHQWTGSEGSDIGEMVNAMEAAIGAGADGIGVALVDLEAFNGPTDKAMAAGIPVLSYNADAPNNASPTSARTCTARATRWASASSSSSGPARSACSSPRPDSSTSSPASTARWPRSSDSGADIDAQDIATGADLTEELNNVEAWYLGNQDAVGMFAVDAGSTQAVGQVVQSQNARDKELKAAGGYDLLPLTVEMVADCTLDFTIDQQPYLQGFLPVVYLYMWKLSGGVVTPPETNTGSRVPRLELGEVVPRHAEPLRGRRRRAEARRRSPAADQRSIVMTEPADGGGRRVTLARRLRPTPRRVNRFWDLVLRKPESTIAVAGIALAVYFSFANDAFLTTDNFQVISQYMIPVAILAVGQTMLLICGEIDLSMGSVYFMTPFLLYFAMDAGLPLPIGIVLALAGAGVVGLRQRRDHHHVRDPVVHRHAWACC